MDHSKQSFELLIEEGGVVTLPDELLRHLGVPPGQEAQIAAEFEPDGSLFLSLVPETGTAHDRI